MPASLRGAVMLAALLVLPQSVLAQAHSRDSSSAQSLTVGKPLNYSVETRVEGSDSALVAAIREASILIQHKAKGATDFPALVARGRADLKQLMAALYQQARYGASVQILIAGKPIDEASITTPKLSNDQPIPVSIAVQPGPVFRVGTVNIKATNAPETSPIIRPEDLGLISGEVAKSSVIATAINKVTQRWHSAGFPLADIDKKQVIADHARGRVDVSISVAPGPPAVYGWINVTGSQQLSNHTVAAQSALRPGRRYDPKDLEKARERLRKLDSIESVRIVEGKQVDQQGSIPITIAVTERKPRYVGVTASVTTFDGAEVKATWGHRNIFGRGEQLRLEGGVSQIGSGSLDDLQFDASATLTKPGIFDIDTDMFAQFRIARESNDVFLSDTVLGKIGFTRRFNETLSGSVALEGRYAREDNEFGETDQVLVSMPASLTRDTRNNRLDPTHGYRAQVELTPVTDVYNGTAFLVSDIDLAGYWTMGAAERATLATRLHAGSIVGSTLQDVPATHRFLAGGGSSVRGYEFQSIGTTVDGIVVGGLSYASASAELRLRLTETIGVVPFIDAAVVSANRLPNFSDSVFVGAGLGLRYNTALGPIRVDAAVPLTNRDDRSAFGVYVGLGQSF